MITAAPTPIIESFIVQFPANVVGVEFFFEAEDQGREISIPLLVFEIWLCQNHPDLIMDFKYHNTEYAENMTNWFDMFNNIETFRKDIQNDFLKYYLNNF
jgi:hypothetical protein